MIKAFPKELIKTVLKVLNFINDFILLIIYYHFDGVLIFGVFWKFLFIPGQFVESFFELEILADLNIFQTLA